MTLVSAHLRKGLFRASLILAFSVLVAASPCDGLAQVRYTSSYSNTNKISGGHGGRSGGLPENACSTQNPADYDYDESIQTYWDRRTGHVGIGTPRHPLTPAVYDGIISQAGATYVAVKQGCMGLLGRNGKILVPFVYNTIEALGDNEKLGRTAILDAQRPEGRMLYEIDTARGRRLGTAGPFELVEATGERDEDNGITGYIAVADHYEGHVGILDSHLRTVLPIKYGVISGHRLANGRGIWIAKSDPQPYVWPNKTISKMWTVDFLRQSGGAPLRSMNAVALWTLPSGNTRYGSYGHYGFVALQADHSCTYVDMNLQVFETGPSLKDRCIEGDDWNRLFITRPGGERVVWTLNPPTSPGQGWNFVEQEQRAYWQHGSFVWQKTFEGRFETVDSPPTGEFVLIKLVDGQGKKTGFMIIDGRGRSDGEIYDKAGRVCSDIYMSKGEQFFHTQETTRTVGGKIVTADPSKDKICIERFLKFDLDAGAARDGVQNSRKPG